MYAHRFVEASN